MDDLDLEYIMAAMLDTVRTLPASEFNDAINLTQRLVAEVKRLRAVVADLGGRPTLAEAEAAVGAWSPYVDDIRSDLRALYAKKAAEA